MFYSTWTKRIIKNLTLNNFKFNYQRTLLPTLNHRSSKEKKKQLSKTVKNCQFVFSIRDPKKQA